MRSRYCAFVVGDEAHLRRSWHPERRPRTIHLDTRRRWLGLEVRRCEAGGADDETGVVEFVARYKVDGRGYRIREVSRFVRIDGAWVYLDGDVQGDAL